MPRLHDGGLVSSYIDGSGPGPKRRYYSITSAGRTALTEDRRIWSSVARAVSIVLDENVAMNA